MSGIQVLLASSDRQGRAELAKIVAECGVQPLTASSVEEVRALLLQGPIQLIFCQDDLPDGGFREILRLAKAARPIAQVVVSCRWGELEEYLEAMQLGAFDFIVPPYRPAEIVSIVYGTWRDFRKNGGDNTLFLRSALSAAPARQVDSSRP